MISQGLFHENRRKPTEECPFLPLPDKQGFKVSEELPLFCSAKPPRGGLESLSSGSSWDLYGYRKFHQEGGLAGFAQVGISLP